MKKSFIFSSLLVLAAFSAYADISGTNCWTPKGGMPPQLVAGGCGNPDPNSWHAKANQLRTGSQLCEEYMVQQGINLNKLGNDKILQSIINGLKEGANTCQNVSNKVGLPSKTQKSKCDLYYESIYPKDAKGNLIVIGNAAWHEPTADEIKANESNYVPENSVMKKCHTHNH